MVIGGLQRFSLSDFPGLISAIVFTRGCGFRCPYCHNPELVDPSRYTAEFPLDEIREFLRSRKGQLQGVVVTGGEPTWHEDLPWFLSELKDMGFAVKLDTNGTKPLMIRQVMTARLVDFIAMDIKAPLALYEQTVKVPAKTSDIQQSIGLILASGLPHEFRTTCVDSLLSAGDLLDIGQLVKGCDRYILQSFHGGRVLDPSLAVELPLEKTRLEEVVVALSRTGLKVETR
ncbi:MAG: anaerobic ribonucleoside-triphosphate reductase activating protein [Spirochaetia bacterium]|jgi:pyruvate formate lyase activating enzyme